MGMFCNQCQEARGNSACLSKGRCGKPEKTSNLQDLLVYTVTGIAIYAEELAKQGQVEMAIGRYTSKALFATITNANFDDNKIMALIREGLRLRDQLKAKSLLTGELHDSALWHVKSENDYHSKAATIGILTTENEDLRSLRAVLSYGIKGVAAYAEHAAMLGYEDPVIYHFIYEAMAATTKALSVDEMLAMIMKTGEVAVITMALLDKANTETYGHPEMTEVNIGVGVKPGILISGHDLRDMEELLKQSEGTGVDVYTHSEMLPANYYPAFKKYDHFVGNYGNAWWKQDEEFASFNGPILMTTNCIVPVEDSYRNRIFTTGVTGYPGVKHIADRAEDGGKDFSEIIELAKTCAAPTEIETGSIVGGFAHAQVFALADKVVDAVKSGAVKKFVVMAGCDGRQASRSYFTDLAQALPQDTIILTAGCAKYRYNKLNLGEIGGIPRVLDAGQCNDSYSLAIIALKLKEIFALEDINDLPIAFDIAWYEQKAVTVLLALLHLGVKGLRLGPTLPAFLSPNVAKVLVDNFDIKGIGSVDEDIKDIMGVAAV